MDSVIEIQSNLTNEISNNNKPDNNIGDKAIRKDPSQSILAMLKNMANISQLLRFSGAALVVISMSMFLGWGEGNDVNRYLKFLMETAILTAAGFSLSYFFNENKGARVFFGLSLISVTVNFTILAALIYSIIQFDGSLSFYPSYLTWNVIDSDKFMIIAASASAFLLLLTRLCYGIFARQSATVLTLASILLNGLLLVPIRNSMHISVLVVCSILIAVYTVKYIVKKSNHLLTFESKFALSSLFIPTAILLGRNLSLYQFDVIMTITLLSVGYIGLRALDSVVSSISKFNAMKEFGKMILAIAIAINVMSLVDYSYLQWTFPLLALLLMGFCYDIHSRSKNNNVSRVITFIFNILITLTLTYYIVSYESWFAIASTFLMGCAISYLGKVDRSKLATSMGLLNIAIALVYFVMKLSAYITLGSWQMVAIAGVVIILAGSILEKYGVNLNLVISNWVKKHYSNEMKETS